RTENLRTPNPGTSNRGTPNPEPRTPNPALFPRRFAPYAMAASLVIVVGGAFVYQATDRSSRVMAAELVADHTKRFALNSALGTFQPASVVEQNMGAAFSWDFHLPQEPLRAGLHLISAPLSL